MASKKTVHQLREFLEEAYLDGWWSETDGDEPQEYSHRAMRIAQSRGQAHAKADKEKFGVAA